MNRRSISFFNETMLGIGVSMEAKQKKNILDPGLEYSTPSVPFIVRLSFVSVFT